MYLEREEPSLVCDFPLARSDTGCLKTKGSFNQNKKQTSSYTLHACISR